ncbi:MAG: class I SAM-dependent methyltransferase [Bacillota bacterium]
MANYNFDRVSDQYDATRGFPPGVSERIARWVLSRLPHDPALLELGVGTGRIAVPFIEMGARYTGFDISEQMLTRLTEKVGGDLRRARVMVHDLHQPFPLPDESQDAVIAVHILHLVDAVTVLGHVRRVLKPGGVLVWGYDSAVEPNPHKMVADRFHVEAEATGYQKADRHVKVGRDLLAQWGTVVTQHTPVAWTEEYVVRAHLEQLRNRVFSSTWNMTDEQLTAALDRTEAWALETFGDLDQPRICERRFVIDWYVIGGT